MPKGTNCNLCFENDCTKFSIKNKGFSDNHNFVEEALF